MYFYLDNFFEQLIVFLNCQTEILSANSYLPTANIQNRERPYNIDGIIRGDL
jgi:hypothetical protein